MSGIDSQLQVSLERIQGAVEASVRQRRAAHAEIANEIATARRAFEATTAGEDATRDEVEALRGALAALELEAESLRTALANAQEATGAADQALASRLEAVEVDRGQLSNALDRARAEIDALRAEIAALRDIPQPVAAPHEPAPETAALVAELADTRLALADAQAEIAALRNAQQGAATVAQPPTRIATIESASISAFDAHGHKRRMGVILRDAGVLTDEQLEEALREQAANPQRRFGAIVVEKGHTTEEVIARILAAQVRLDFVDLAKTPIDEGARGKVSPHLARLHKAVPLRVDDGVLTLAMANPFDLIAVEDIEIASGCRVNPVVATPTAIDAALG